MILAQREMQIAVIGLKLGQERLPGLWHRRFGTDRSQTKAQVLGAATPFFAGSSPSRPRFLRKEPQQALCQISLLPRKAAIRFRRTTEMAVGRCACINRPVKAEILANSPGRQRQAVAQRRFKPRVVHPARAMRVDIDGQWL